MRKITNLCIAVLTFFMLSCSNGEQARLRIMLDQINADCPANYADCATLEGMSYDKGHNTVLVNFTLNEDVAEIVALRKTTEYQKKLMASFLRNDVPEFLEQIVKAESALTLIYKADQSGDSVAISLWPDELKELLEAEEDENDSRHRLELIVGAANAQCPAVIEDGLIMTGARLNDSYISFFYTYDSDDYELTDAVMPILEETTRQNLREELTQPASSAQLQLMKENGIGVKYVYAPSAEDCKTQIITITPEEVAGF